MLLIAWYGPLSGIISFANPGTSHFVGATSVNTCPLFVDHWYNKRRQFPRYSSTVRKKKRFNAGVHR